MIKVIILFLAFNSFYFNYEKVKALECTEIFIDGEDISDGTIDGDDEILDNEEEIINLEEYYSFLENIEKLENCAIDYIKERDIAVDKLKYSKEKLVYTYIRSKKYNSSHWKFLAGEIDINFDNYVKEKDVNLEKLKSIDYIIIPSGEKVDVVHMFASIDMEKEGFGCVGSWGGDLVQVINQLKNVEGTREELYESFKGSINVPGYFSNEDMNADLDALNIYKRIRKKRDDTITIKEIIEDYYLELNNEKRINEFIDNKYKFETYNKENLKEAINLEFLNDSYVDLLMDLKEIDYALHRNHIYAALDVFEDYIYSIYNGKQVNNKKEEIVEKDEKVEKDEEKEENNDNINEDTKEYEEVIEVIPIIIDDDLNNMEVNTIIEEVIVDKKEENIEEVSKIVEESSEEMIVEETIKESTINTEEILEEDNLFIEVEKEDNEINELFIIVSIIVSILIFIIFVISFDKEEDNIE